MALSNYSLLLYIALAAFVIGLIIVAVDFVTDGTLSVEGRNAFVVLVALAVIVVIIAVILERVVR